jgi:hypothetical protein
MWRMTQHWQSVGPALTSQAAKKSTPSTDTHTRPSLQHLLYFILFTSYTIKMFIHYYTQSMCVFMQL